MSDFNSTYRILSEYQYKKWGDSRKHVTSPYQSLDLLKHNHPGISESTRLLAKASEIRYGDQIFAFSGIYAESNFFSFFDFELKEGSLSALQNPNSIVLGEELTEKLFPNTDPLGKQVDLKDLGSFLVTGVVKSLDSRTHLEFDALLSFSSFDQLPNAADLKNDWIAGSKQFHNYFKVDPLHLSDIQSSLDGFISLLPVENQSGYAFTIQALSENSLGELMGNRLGFVTPLFVALFLAVLALVLILSATFNYMGLAIALGLRRAKEVGIRKIVGAAKRQIFIQFLVEAQVTVLISWVFSLALLGFLIPEFNELKILRDIDGKITLDLWENFYVYFVFFVFAIVIGFVAGGYPAWYVGKMSFSKALGREASKSNKPTFVLRKSLTFIQYTTSVIFIISAIVLYRQSTHFIRMDYGFDTTNLINVPLKDIPYESFKTELLREPQIEGVSLTSNMPGLEFMDKKEIYTPGSTEPVDMSTFAANEDFLENFKLDVLDGRNFNSEIQSDRNAVLINALALEAMGFDINEPGATLKITQDGDPLRVIGVIEDFKYDLLFRESGPLILTYAAEGPRFVNIRYSDWDEKTAAITIEGVWREFDKLHPFDYKYYEYQLYDMYDEFMDITRIVGLVALLAILIACLGQFGMVLHHVQLKLKEVGIRKALGATHGQLNYLLAKNFLLLIIFSVLVGTPLAWWINDLWTGGIPYGVEMNLSSVIIGLALVFSLALASIVSLTWRTANSNPVDSLRYE